MTLPSLVYEISAVAVEWTIRECTIWGIGSDFGHGHFSTMAEPRTDFQRIQSKNRSFQLNDVTSLVFQ